MPIKRLHTCIRTELGDCQAAKESIGLIWGGDNYERPPKKSRRLWTDHKAGFALKPDSRLHVPGCLACFLDNVQPSYTNINPPIQRSSGFGYLTSIIDFCDWSRIYTLLQLAVSRLVYDKLLTPDNTNRGDHQSKEKPMIATLAFIVYSMRKQISVIQIHIKI